jgi:hypothetical protein
MKGIFMARAYFIRIATLAVLAAACVGTVEAQAHTRAQKAHVHFLATSTVLRGSWGFNQDVFLVELRFAAHGEPVLARLIDEYPSLFPPLTAEVLSSPSETVFRVRRDAQCDLPYRKVLLRTAPGDPMAILPERLSYQPKLEKTPQPDEVLPCYRTAKR